MANVDAIIQEGVAAIKAGRKDDAKRVLMRAIDLDERSEQAWLWLSACVDTPEEQQICLENVLSINPGSQKARKGLDAISKQRAQPQQPPRAAQPQQSPSAPAAGSPFGDNPFAGTGFDSNPYASNSNSSGALDPALGSGWDTFGASDPFSSGSSVDWGKPDAPAAYGSGKEVPAPSAAEYDNWVSNLQLGGGRNAAAGNGSGFSAPPASSPSPASDPFGGAGFDDGSFNNPFDAPSTGTTAPAGSAFGDNGGGFGASPFGGSPFDSSTYDSPTYDAPGSNGSPMDTLSFDNSSYDASSFDSGPFGANSAPANQVPAFDSSDFGDTGFDSTGFDGGFGDGPFGTSAPSTPQPSSFSNAPSKSAALNRPSPPVSDPFGGASFGSSSSAFDDPVDNLFNNVPGSKSRIDPFGGSKTDPFANTSLEQYAQPPDLERDNLEDLFAPLDNGSGKSEPRRATSTMAGMHNYYADIPAEIQARAKTSPRMALIVGVLALLNAVSLALLVLNVMRR